jgi:hypothetical protein
MLFGYDIKLPMVYSMLIVSASMFIYGSERVRLEAEQQTDRPRGKAKASSRW